MDYAELVDRNWGFVSPDAQGRIRGVAVLLAGCGLGSNVAVLAARTGFVRFILADGDSVEVTNLNRQAFRTEHVGVNKAEATAQLLREINPQCDVQAYPRRIEGGDAAWFVDKADIVVNMVDPGPALYLINQAARQQGKLSLFPMNIGFGGVALAFTPGSATLEDMVGEAPEHLVFARLLEKVIPSLPYLGKYVADLAEVVDDILRGVRPTPQLGIAASISAALVVSAMVRHVVGLPIRATPEALALDCQECGA